jgi:hypothetical protein
MAAGDIKLVYGTTTAITITASSLASGSARECTAIDNSSNLFQDAMVYGAIGLASGTPGSDKAIYIWFYGSEDGTNYTDNVTGSDAAVTMRSPTNLRGPFTVLTPDSGALTYKFVVPSVNRYFGGLFLPRKWGFVIQNQTNLALSTTAPTFSYTGIYQNIAA